MVSGCSVCGHPGEFRVEPGDSLREAWCPACKAKKRTSDLAATIIVQFGGAGARSLAGMTDTLARLAIHEAQATGPLHDLLSKLPGYSCSEYLDGVPEGETARDGVRCENLERLTFPDNAFDLVITQDVMEHVSQPEQAFREIHRVLKPGGCHIFTVPVHEGRKTIARTRTVGKQLVDLSFPVYHGDPLRKEMGSRVHTDFGGDLVSYLAQLAIPSEMIYSEPYYAQDQIPWLADEASHAHYLSALESGNTRSFFIYNSVVIKAWKPMVASNRNDFPEFSGERYLPNLDWPQVAFEHWHRYFHAAELVSGKSVLDIACGEGYGSFALASRASRVIGIDLDGDTIKRAASRYARDNLSFRTGSCVAIPVEENAVFDAVVCFETIEHLSALEQKMFLAEVKRLLKPDGLFIVSTPNKLLYSDLPNQCNDYHVKEFYVGEFRELLGNSFAHVKLLGQKVYPVSYIWNEDRDCRRFTEHGLEYRDGQFQRGEEAKKLLYMIALCSDQEIAESGASILIDLSERWMKFIKDLEAYGAHLTEKLRESEAGRAAACDQINALQEQLRQQNAEIAKLSAIAGAQPNAYDSAGQARFGLPPQALRGTRLAQQIGIKVINLARRPDRLASFHKMLERAASAAFMSRVERFAAVDGRTLSLTPEIHHTYRDNDFAYRRGFIGCAQSHLALWKELASGTAPAFLILEDDVSLCRDFEGKLIELCGQLEDYEPGFDIVLLGYTDWHPRDEDNVGNAARALGLRPFEGQRYLGGLFAYLVSRRGAQRLLAIVERDGIQNGIDRFVHVKETELRLLMISPHLARTILAPPGSRLDSDIQHDCESLPASDTDYRRNRGAGDSGKDIDG